MQLRFSKTGNGVILWFNYHSYQMSAEFSPTFDTLIRRSWHYNAWKVSTWSLLVRIEMLQLMNKMSANILNFVIGWNKPHKFWKCNQMSQ